MWTAAGALAALGALAVNSEEVCMYLVCTLRTITDDQEKVTKYHACMYVMMFSKKQTQQQANSRPAHCWPHEL